MAHLLSYIGDFLLLVNLILSISIRPKNRTIIFFIVCQFCIFIVQTAGTILSTLGERNLFLSHYYFVGQFILLSLFYYSLLNKSQRRVVLIAQPAVLIPLAIQYTVSPDVYWKFNHLEILLTALPIIAFAAFHFYNQLDGPKQFHLINLSIMMYLFGSTVLFLAGNTVNVMLNDRARICWDLNSVLYILFQLCVLHELRGAYLKSPIPEHGARS